MPGSVENALSLDGKVEKNRAGQQPDEWMAVKDTEPESHEHE
jgi:hypothetical protein